MNIKIKRWSLLAKSVFVPVQKPKLATFTVNYNCNLSSLVNGAFYHLQCMPHSVLCNCLERKATIVGSYDG